MKRYYLTILKGGGITEDVTIVSRPIDMDATECFYFENEERATIAVYPNQRTIIRKIEDLEVTHDQVSHPSSESPKDRVSHQIDDL